MTRVLGIGLGLLLALSHPAHAGWFGFGKTNASTTPSSTTPSGTSGYKYGSGYTATKVSYWKHRYLQRQQIQWQKSGGVNFPSPRVATTTTPTPNTKVASALKQQKKQGFWTRLRTAWRSRWSNRQITADRNSPLKNQSGFGKNVRRAQSQVAYSWRHRLDKIRMKTRQRRTGIKRRAPSTWRRPPPGW